MFDNAIFEKLILKKDIDGLKSYLQKNISSNQSEDIFSSAKAVYFCILKTDISLNFIPELKEQKFTEMLRRMLFCYIRNNPPSDVRQKARKILISMGFPAVESNEKSYSPLVWNFYEVFYRYELANRPKVFSKLVKVLAKTKDSYTRDSAVNFVKHYQGKVVDALIDYFKLEENSTIKEVYEFLEKFGTDLTDVVPPQVATPTITKTVETPKEKNEDKKSEEISNSKENNIANDKDILKAQIKEDMQKKWNEKNISSPISEVKEPTPVTEVVEQPVIQEEIQQTVSETPVTEVVEQPVIQEEIQQTVSETPVTEVVEQPVIQEEIQQTVSETPATEVIEQPVIQEEIATNVNETPVAEVIEQPVIQEEIQQTVSETPITEVIEQPVIQEEIQQTVSETPVAEVIEQPVTQEEVQNVVQEEINTNVNETPVEQQTTEQFNEPKTDSSRILKSSFVSSQSVLIPAPKAEDNIIPEPLAVEEPVIESNIIEEQVQIQEKKPTRTPMELKDALKLNFVNIKFAGKGDISPTLMSTTIEMLLELIEVGSERDMTFVENSITKYFVTNPFMQDALRRELKIFMSDSELPEFVSKRAMELLPLLGKTKQKQSLSSILMTLSEINEEEEQEENFAEVASSIVQIPIEEDIAHSVSDRILSYLKSTGSYDSKLETCQNMIEAGITFEEYYNLIDFDLMKSGKRFFDRIIPAAKAIILSDRPDFKTHIEEAKYVLFVSLLYGNCPDILKMECFETLKRSGYLDILSAKNIYKQYAIVFVKDSLLNKSSGAACRALSDMINIIIPGAIGRDNFVGKNIEALVDSYISLIVKETDEYLFDYAVDILNHLSFEEHSILIPLSARIQPVNYEKAIEITEKLVTKRNLWASDILIEAVGENYMDIRNKAVDALSRCGSNMPLDYRKRAVNLIFAKLEETYDEDKQAQYIEVARNIDLVITAEVLISLFANSGLTDRKEIGNRLMGTLAIMSSKEFLELFKGLDNLRILHKYLTSSHRDRFTVDFARQFIDLYRLHFSNLNGEETWRNILSDTNSEFVDMINELWNLQF